MNLLCILWLHLLENKLLLRKSSVTLATANEAVEFLVCFGFRTNAPVI